MQWPQAEVGARVEARLQAHAEIEPREEARLLEQDQHAARLEAGPQGGERLGDILRDMSRTRGDDHVVAAGMLCRHRPVEIEQRRS